jgi:hypothetical protein
MWRCPGRCDAVPVFPNSHQDHIGHDMDRRRRSPGRQDALERATASVGVVVSAAPASLTAARGHRLRAQCQSGEQSARSLGAGGTGAGPGPRRARRGTALPYPATVPQIVQKWAPAGSGAPQPLHTPAGAAAGAGAGCGAAAGAAATGATGAGAAAGAAPVTPAGVNDHGTQERRPAPRTNHPRRILDDPAAVLAALRGERIHLPAERARGHGPIYELVAVRARVLEGRHRSLL